MTNRKLAEIVRRQNPVSLPSDATVQEACRLMHKHRIGAMLVTEDGGRLVGVFTGRDAVGRVVAEARDPATTILRDVMTASPDTIAPHASAVQALRTSASSRTAISPGSNTRGLTKKPAIGKFYDQNRSVPKRLAVPASPCRSRMADNSFA